MVRKMTIDELQKWASQVYARDCNCMICRLSKWLIKRWSRQ